MPKQLNLLAVAKGEITLQNVINNFWFYVWTGQIIVFILSTIFVWLQNTGKNYDVVIFPGLVHLGLDTLGVGPIMFIFIRLLLVLLLNILLVFLSYRFSKFLGAWFFSIFIIFLALINFGMLLYW